MKNILTICIMLFSMIQSSYAYDLTVAKDGSGNYTTVQAAIDAAPTNLTAPYTIFIKNGTYKEKITVPSNKPFLQFIGESVANVILTYDDYNGKPMPGGGTFGTSNSASITINATDFTAVNITFENTTGESPQALAINVNNDRCAFKNCRFLGGQDTLLANNSGKRQYYKQCYIDGTVDFIFGNATAIFDDCTLYPKTRTSGTGSSYITAANTQSGIPYGYVFRNCTIQMNRGTTSYYLGRPWQNTTSSSPVAENKTVFLNTIQSGSVILPAGWSTWDGTTNTALITYAEYQSVTQTGAAVDVSQRVAWSQQLNATQAANYTNANIFGAWDPCTNFTDGCTVASPDIAVSNFTGVKGASTATFTWNASWGIDGVTYTLFRSTDNKQSFQSIYSATSSGVYDVNFSTTDANPPAGSTYYYYVVGSKSGLSSHTTAQVSISSTPTLTVGTLNSFLQGVGTPSNSQSYILTGINLLGNVTVTAPTNFELSTNNATWSTTPLSITPTSGSVTQTIYVRLNGSTAGSYNGTIVHTSSGAADATVAVVGTIQNAPLQSSIVLASFPMTASNADDAGSRATGITVGTPSFTGLVASDGTTVPAVPAYGATHGQAFAATATGLWTTTSGGPGGNVNLNNYEQFTITANADYSVRIDSLTLNASFYNTSSNTRLAVLYSKAGFASDINSFTGGILGSDGSALTTTANTQNSPLFTTTIALTNLTASNGVNYRLALNGTTGVTLSAGQTLTVRLYFSCGSSSTGRYGKIKDVTFKGLVSSSLPLSIIHFSAEKNRDHTNTLKWTTADEINVSHFDIERSANGQNFEPIGRTTATGSQKAQQHYTQLDKTPLSTTNYYRLKSVDFDGSVTYSKTITVDNSPMALVHIKAYPNPVSDQLTLVHTGLNSDLTFTITDIRGQKHRVKTIQKGEQTTIDVQSLTNGLYFIECRYKNDNIVLKFEKQ